MGAPFVLWEGHWVSSESGLGLEAQKWNKPYRYEHYPRMLYRAQRLPGSGKWVTGSLDDMAFTTSCQLIVNNDEEYEAAKRSGLGWSDNPALAVEWALALEKQISTAAAERLAQDNNMSEKAKAEAAQFESENFGHQPEIPEAKRRGRPRKDAA